MHRRFGYRGNMRIDTERCRILFSRSPVARLATANAEGCPHIVPVTFAAHRDRVAIGIDHKPKSSRRLKRLHNIAENPPVSLLADEYRDDWSELWWVRADGRASILDPGAPTWSSWWAELARRYPQYRADPPDGPVIVVAVTRWSGWASTDPVE
jgi:PPOX class probable F420-dependent enzyme